MDSFDVDDFVRRFTLATGLDVETVPTAEGQGCQRRFSIRANTGTEHTGDNKVTKEIFFKGCLSSITQNSGIKKHQEEVQVKLMTSLNDKSHGSLFLRIGAMAFGLGTLIYTGLEFLAFFEVPRTCRFWQVLQGVNPVLYMVFVFMQMYYIFMHSRLNVNKNKVETSQ